MKPLQHRLRGLPAAAMTIADPGCQLALSGAAHGQLVADPAAPGKTARLEPAHADVLPADGDGFVPVRFRPDGDPCAASARGRRRLGPGAAAGEIRMHLQNAMPWPVTVDLRLDRPLRRHAHHPYRTAAGRPGHPDGSAAGDAAAPLGHAGRPAHSLDSRTRRRSPSRSRRTGSWIAAGSQVCGSRCRGRLRRRRCGSARSSSTRMPGATPRNALPTPASSTPTASTRAASGRRSTGRQDPQVQPGSETDTEFARFAQCTRGFRHRTPTGPDEVRLDAYGGLLDAGADRPRPCSTGLAPAAGSRPGASSARQEPARHQDRRAGCW